MGKVLWYAFILIALLIVVAYYKGFSSDAQTVGGALNKLVLYLQGRNDQGNFAGYPTGGN